MATPQTVARPQGAALSDAALVEINRLWTIVRAFSSLAHDVNNALQVVSGSAELLASGDLDEGARRRVEAVRTKAAEAAMAINRLLAYARDVSSTARADLAALAESAAAMRAATLGRSGVVVTLDRSSRGSCVVPAGHSSMLQMLLNLLLCAEEVLRAAEGGRVVVRTGREAAGVVVAVEIRPGGLRRESQEPSTELTAMTTGAQLWAAARLADAAGGRLDVVTEDSGVTLKVTLPSA